MRQGDWKLHLPRKQEQLPFWDKNKAFCQLKAPVLYNLADDPSESKDVSDDNAEVIKRMLGHVKSIRKELGEFMQRGSGQRPTGSIYPDAPVISHEKDWGSVEAAVVEGLNMERAKRHPGWKSKSGGKKKRKKK